MVTDFPTPAVTPPNWGQQLIDAIVSRYTDRVSVDNTQNDQLDALEEKGTVAYAQNTSAIGHSNLTSLTVVPAMNLIVEPTDGDIWIRWGAYLGNAVVGAGWMLMQLFEIDNDANVTLLSTSLNREYADGFVNAFAAQASGEYRIGPVTTVRNFYLATQTWQEAGSSYASYLVNSYPSAPGVEAAKTWMAAIAQ